MAFRPNPERGVFVNAPIDQDLLDRLTPRIISLQAVSREPISVFIDSPGGSTVTATILERLLRSSNQDFAPPCRIITVVTATAASAAADLLAAGDYAIAYEESTVYFHGVRTSPSSPVTREVASELSQYLRLRNESYAMALARKSIHRMIFLQLLLRGGFPDYRAAHGDRLTDIDCFLGRITERLGPVGVNLVQRAAARNAQHDMLLDHLSETALQTKKFQNAKRTAEREAILIKSLVDFELSANTAKDWTFRRHGLTNIVDDFLLVIEFIERRDSQEVIRLYNRWADFYLSPAEKQELELLPKDERQDWKIARLRPHLQPIWFFCVSLCQALQEGENELTAEEAYWLGLVDEVIGASHLDCLRMLVESNPARR